MPIQFDNFDQKKIDRLKNHLVTMAEKSKAKFFEIYVDALKAVPKTDEVDDFDAYEDYITVDTEQIKIIIYNTALSPRNDQYVFVLKAKNKEEAQNLGLNGMPIQKFSQTSISDWRVDKERKNEQNFEVQRLHKENAELKRQLADNKSYIESLEELIEKAKKNSNKIGGIHIGDVLSVAFEGLLRRNTHIIAKLPMASELAGIIENDNKRLATNTKEPSADSEASFQKIDANINTTALNEKDRVLLELIKEIQSQFEENEFGSVMEILDSLSKDKSLIKIVFDLLQENEEEESEEETTK